MTRANYCRQCGKRIETRTNKKFCSNSCRSRFNYEKKVGQKANRRCKECGGPIPHSARRNTVYCCKECSKKAAIRANNERRKLKRERAKNLSNVGIATQNLHRRTGIKCTATSRVAGQIGTTK